MDVVVDDNHDVNPAFLVGKRQQESRGREGKSREGILILDTDGGGDGDRGMGGVNHDDVDGADGEDDGGEIRMDGVCRGTNRGMDGDGDGWW